MTPENRIAIAYEIETSEEEHHRNLCVPICPREEYTVDEALVYIGHGNLQRILMIVLGLGCATFSANIMLMSYLEPNERLQ